MGNLSGMERERMRANILQEASIVFSTLSGAGSAAFHRLARHFDVVVVDEAAQAVEPSILVPLVMGCKQVSKAKYVLLQRAQMYGYSWMISLVYPVCMCLYTDL